MAPSDVVNLPVQSRLPAPRSLSDRGFSQEQWRVLVDVTFPTAKSPESVLMAIDYCRARNLDIFKKPIHIVPMYSAAKRAYVETIWPGINEIQITAARTGAWAGMDPPKWGPDVTRAFVGEKRDNGTFQRVSVEVTFPEWCAVTVYRMVGGQPRAFCEPVYWTEAYSTSGGRNSELPTDMWVKRPRGQLHKVAKAASLRAAFPEEGEYTAEEMEGKEIEGGGVVIEGSAAEAHAPQAGKPAQRNGTDGGDGNAGDAGDEIAGILDHLSAAVRGRTDIVALDALWADSKEDRARVREHDPAAHDRVVALFRERGKALRDSAAKVPAQDAPAGRGDPEPLPPQPWTIEVPRTGDAPDAPFDWGAFAAEALRVVAMIPDERWGAEFVSRHRMQVKQLAKVKEPAVALGGEKLTGAQAAERISRALGARFDAIAAPAAAAE